MKHKHNLRIPFSIYILILFGLNQSLAQVTVFSDDFNTDNNAAWTTSGQIGASDWTVFRNADDWGGRRHTGPTQLELINDVGGVANADGYVFASTPSASFADPYEPRLNQGGKVTWTFNMRQIRTDPSGFNGGNYGIAVILAGETATANTTGSGYAVVLGQALSTDPVRLVRYTGGISGNATITNIIISNTTGLTDFGTQHLSIMVTYDPCNGDTWELFVRDDGASFADPLSGTLTSQGTAVDNTNTNTILGMMACYWQGSITAAQDAYFDNITVTATSRPDINLGPDPIVCMGALSASLSYSNLTGSPTEYSIDYNAAANANGFVDVTNAPLPSSPITLVLPGTAPVGNYAAVFTVRNVSTGCSSVGKAMFIVVNNCTAPYMTFVYLPEGEVHGSCVSATDCDEPEVTTICYGLEYTPNVTGTLTSYTTGFFVDCSSLGNPILSNTACLMTPANAMEDDCANSGLVKFNSSGNTGSTLVTKNIPIILAQVCLDIPAGESLNINEDIITNLSTSIDSVNGGGPESEFPGSSQFTANSIVPCQQVPLKWLEFQASKYGDLKSLLDWTTAEEVNVSHFEIQRSNDSGKHFHTIGYVDASQANEQIKSYQFIDLKALSGNNYYRLKELDYDGKYDFSPVKVVAFASEQFSASVWPNPVSSLLTISIQQAEEAGNMAIVDITGKEVFNSGFDRGDSHHEILVENLQAGIYTLVLNSGGHHHIDKIVIID